MIYRLTNTIPTGDIWRGLGRKRPHLTFMLGVWICMLLKPSGSLLACSSGKTPEEAWFKVKREFTNRPV